MSATSAGETTSGIDALYAHVDAARTPGGVAAVLRGDDIIHQGTYGRANCEFDIPWTPETRYPVASITKTFVADLMLRLFDTGRVSPDARLLEFFPDFGTVASSITLAHLLTMTSGYRHDEVCAGLAGGANWSNEGLYEVMRRQRSLQHPTGSFHNYHCGGYRLLAKVIERLTGESFEEALRRHTFEPLGMFDSTAPADWSQIDANRASIYSPSADGSFHRIQEEGQSSGDGAVRSTLKDMLCFARYLRKPDHTGQRRIARLAAAVPLLRHGDRGHYGYGLFVDRLGTRSAWGHSGSTNCRYLYVPEDDLSVLCLHNHHAVRAVDTAEQIARVALGELPVPAADLPAWAESLSGVYANADNGFLFEISLCGRHLYARIHDEVPYRLGVKAPGVLGFADRASPFVLHVLDDAELMVVEATGRPFRCSRMLPRVLAAEAAALHAGTYYCPDLGALHEIVVQGNALTLLLGAGVSSEQRLSLQSLDNELFVHQGTSVRFERTSDGRQAMVLSRNRARDLLFLRTCLPPR